MGTKFSLSTQRMALDYLAQDAKAIYRKKCRPSEAEHMSAALAALRITLDWLAEHEADIREWVSVQKALDREAPEA